ncbi:MAG: NUDIX hydrolase [Firmicutes bacterium]|nr:NUDIX hydrolase [Bacillota bacterium]
MDYLYKGWLKIHKKEYKSRTFEVLEDKDAVGALVEDSNGKFLLVRQFRVPLDRNSLEIPAGCIDKDGLTPEEIMVEELQEEADIKVNVSDLKLISDSCPNIGISRGSYRLYYCKYNGVGTNKTIDDEDVFETLWITPEEFLEKIEIREIRDTKSQLAYYMIMNTKMTQF